MLIGTILKQEQQFPSKGWSRGIDLNSGIETGTTPLITKKNGNYYIYSKTQKALNVLVLNSEFKVKARKQLPVKVPDYTQFWTDGTQTIYVANNQLVSLINGTKTILAPNVEGMTPYGNQVILWKQNKLYRLNPATTQVTYVASAPYPIDQVMTKAGSNLLLIKSKVFKTSYIELGIVRLNETIGTYQALDQIQQSYNSDIEDLDFQVIGHKLFVVYSQYGSTQGGMFRNNYLTLFNAKSFKKQSKTVLLNIKDSTTGLIFDGPENIQLNERNGQLSFVFVEQSTLFRGEDAQNIFLSTLNGPIGKKMLAKPISSSIEPSANPVWLTRNTVLWNEYIGNHNTLVIGSQNPSIIQQSDHINGRDWGHAISIGLMHLMVSLLMLGYAFLWVIPTGMFVVGMFFSNMTLMEKDLLWIKLVGVLLFLGTQLIFVRSLFNATFQRFSPAFLQFPGNAILIPVVLMVLAWFLTEWVKNDDWGNGAYIFYCLILDVLLLGFLIGPYTL